MPSWLADVMEGADVRMVQAGDGLGFPLEPLAEIGVGGHMRREDLDGDRAIQAGVGGLADFAHPAYTKGRLDLVRSDRGAKGEGHGLIARVPVPDGSTDAGDAAELSPWRGRAPRGRPAARP